MVSSSVIDEIDAQPRAWRRTADREMDYADGNQLETELIRHMKSQGIPVVRENLIAGSLEGIRPPGWPFGVTRQSVRVDFS